MALREMDTTLVTVGIVNWNCSAFLPDCLQSLFSQTCRHIEVLLIDNASTDGSPALVEKNFPRVRVIRNVSNRGYAAAQNQALARGRGNFYMALNPDVVLEPDYIGTLLDALDRNRQAGYAIGKIRILTPGGEKTDRIYSTGHLFPRNRQGYNRGINQPDRGQWDGMEIVPGANGSCPIYRRKMINDLSIDGHFWDEMFFMYGDDLDIDWRAAMRGWKCLYVPEALAYHVGSGTGSLKRRATAAMFVAHRYLMILKNDSPGNLMRDLPYFARATLRELAALLIRRPDVLVLAMLTFCGKLPRALRGRRILRLRRSHQLRPWFQLSLQLIREERGR